MSSIKPRLLVVLTSHTTGWYLPEFAHPWSVLEPVFNITVASPKGGEAPLDKSSIDGWMNDHICAKFLRTKEHLWMSTQRLEMFLDRVHDFDAVFYVGGYGPMFDLADTPTSHNLLLAFHAASKPISAICHGPAPLALLRDPSTGEFVLKGHRVTGLSKAEIDLMPTHVPVPFELEQGLSAASGGGYEKAAEPWGERVVVSTANGRTIITGQNPASGKGLAEALVKVVLERKSG